MDELVGLGEDVTDRFIVRTPVAMVDRRVRPSRLAHLQAIESLEDCMEQIVQTLADTDDPERAAELSDRLSDLDTGHDIVQALLRGINPSLSL